MIWRLAWRNLWRHRGRTLIMTSAVAGAYGLMLVSMGVSDDGHGGAIVVMFPAWRRMRPTSL